MCNEHKLKYENMLPEHRITGKHLTAKEIRAKHNVEQIVDIE